jgi:hypothetical protein
MKYFSVRVHPSHSSTISMRFWEVTYDKTSSMATMEREEVKTVPNALGFFHYPETMSDEQARTDLILCMIESHDQEIAELRTSRDALLNLLP